MADNRILVHEIGPGVFVRWPSGHPIVVTYRTEEVVVRRGGEIVSTAVQACDPYQREEVAPADAGPSFWRNHSEEELADRGLAWAEPFVPPAGWHAAGAERFERDGEGVLRQVFDVEEDPPPPPPPSKEERFAALAAAAGMSPEELAEMLAPAAPRSEA